MIWIASTLLLCMVSVGNGNPVPEPDPDPNIFIHVRQLIPDQEGMFDHPTTSDQEDPFGPPTTDDQESTLVHPTTDAPADVETTLDIGAILEKEKEAIDNSIIEAQQAIDVAQAAIDDLEDEVAEDQAEIDAVDGILGELSHLFGLRRKRRSLSENVKGILGRLGDLYGESHRSRRASNSGTLTISYCLEGDITDTGFELYSKALTDIKAAIKHSYLPLALCLNDVLRNLKAEDILLTTEETDALKAQANAAEHEAEVVKDNKEDALMKKKAQLDAKKAIL